MRRRFNRRPIPSRIDLPVKAWRSRACCCCQFTSFAVSAAATVMLLYFLLASERWLTSRRTVQQSRGAAPRGLLLSGVRRRQRDIAYFFETQLLINCGVGMPSPRPSWWRGLPNPVLWGSQRVLNFIP